MRSVLLIDNYDSFTYNLAHYLESLDVHVTVCRNDEVNEKCNDFDAVILSPGPGLPADAGDMMRVIEQCDGMIPVLGVCLGMQGICEYLGGKLFNLEKVKHGVGQKVFTKESILFKGIPNEITVGLYHSWAVSMETGNFDVTSKSSEEVVMSIENRERKFFGVQFHPESILTEFGKELLANFLDYSK